MIPRCPECERRDRDNRFDNLVFANSLVTAIGCGLVGSILSQQVAVLFTVLGAIVGWVVGWRTFVRGESEGRKPS